MTAFAEPRNSLGSVCNPADREAGPQTDKLIRFLVASLSPELRTKISKLVEELPDMKDCEQKNAEIQIDPQTMEYEYA